MVRMPPGPCTLSVDNPFCTYVRAIVGHFLPFANELVALGSVDDIRAEDTVQWSTGPDRNLVAKSVFHVALLLPGGSSFP